MTELPDIFEAAAPQERHSAFRRVFIRDLVLSAEIGVWKAEQGRRQKVRFNVILFIKEDGPHHGDRLEGVVCYHSITQRIHALLNEGHITLVETLAERTAEVCLEDRRVDSVTVRVEKLEAISEAASVGVEITRKQR